MSKNSTRAKEESPKFEEKGSAARLRSTLVFRGSKEKLEQEAKASEEAALQAQHKDINKMLRKAVERGNNDKVIDFIQKGANPNQKDENGMPLLHEAILKGWGNDDFIAFLLNREGINLVIVAPDRTTAGHLLAKKGKEVLLDKWCSLVFKNKKVYAELLALSDSEGKSVWDYATTDALQNVLLRYGTPPVAQVQNIPVATPAPLSAIGVQTTEYFVLPKGHNQELVPLTVSQNGAEAKHLLERQETGFITDETYRREFSAAHEIQTPDLDRALEELSKSVVVTSPSLPSKEPTTYINFSKIDTVSPPVSRKISAAPSSRNMLSDSVQDDSSWVAITTKNIPNNPDSPKTPDRT
jgi:hypothetical protein